MKTRFTILLAACATVMAACSKVDTGIPAGGDGTMEVSLGLPLITAESRTAVDDTTGETIWNAGDKIALWATSGDGTNTLEGAVFTMWHYDTSYNTAYFTATINTMPEGEYTYMATSPAPTKVEGLTATYTIPATQNGRNDSLTDIMIADPLSAGQLNAGRNELDLKFKHVLHAVKITIPADGNMMNRPVTRFEMTFPTAVVGDVTVDPSDPEAAFSLDNGTNTVTFEFDEPKQAGDSFWAVIYPAYIDGEITYKAYSDGYTSKEKSFSVTKQCLAGHVTPMLLTIPTLDLTTTITFSVGESFLGEEINSFTITDMNGSNLFDTFVRNDENSYAVTFDGEFFTPSYSGQPAKAVFESENAIVTQTFTMPEIVPYTTNTVAPIRVPYLLEEDFSGLTATSGDTFSESETNQSTTPDGVSLTKYGLAEGWSGARVGGQTGLSVRVNTKFETGLFAKATYKGQLDTPQLSGLKDGKTVTLKVDFDADAAGDYTTCYVGNITATGAVNGETAISNGTTINMTAMSGIAFSSVFTSRTASVPNCTSAHRIALQPNTTRSGELSVKFYDHFIYFDNIRISIQNQ